MESVAQTAQRLNSILLGKKKDKEKEEVILDVIKANNLKKRLDIAHQYYIDYESPLYEDIKAQISGDFCDCACQMFLSPLDFAVKNLEKAIKKKYDSGIFEQLTPRNLDELALIEEAYKKDTDKDLKKDLEKIYSKEPMKTHVMNIFKVKRNINTSPNNSECEKCANTLSQTPEKKWLADENIFKDIFLKKSPEELVVIARYFNKKKGKNLVDAVDEMSDPQATLVKEVLYNNIMPHEIAAEKIRKSIKGLGTDEELLSRILVARCELDMAKIREMYFYKYKITMKDDIIDDTSGNYQKICVYLGDK